MAYVILGLAFFGILHFIYESIIAPTLRAKERMDMLALSAELKEIAKANRAFASSKAYAQLSESLNAILHGIFSLELLTVLRLINEIEDNVDIQKKLLERRKLLDNLDIPEARAVRERSLKLAIRSFRYNVFGWSFYVVPLLAFFACLGKIKSLMKSLIAMPSADLFRLAKTAEPVTKFA